MRAIRDPADADPGHAAFHAQQLAEKSLKAWLEFKEVETPYTHTIRRLLERRASNGLDVSRLKEAEDLTPYCVTTRYPDISQPVSLEEARQALATARQVQEAVHGALRAAGFPNEMIPK